MSQGYQVVNPSEAHFLNFQIMDWVDVFTRDIYRREIVNSLSYCRKAKGLIVYAYVVMTNHMHLVERVAQGNLPDVIRDFKKFTASQILRMIKAGEWLYSSATNYNGKCL